jgi:hypothetical protein
MIDNNHILPLKGPFLGGFGNHTLLKTVAFIAGKKNPVVQKKIIRFSIEN